MCSIFRNEMRKISIHLTLSCKNIINSKKNVVIMYIRFISFNQTVLNVKQHLFQKINLI